MDAPVSFDLVADILADGRLGPLGGDFSVGGGEMPLPGGRRLILDALSGQIDVPAGQQVARLEALHLRSNLASFDGSARLLASETPLGVLRGATLQVLLNDLDLAPGLGLKHGLRARYLDAMVQFDRPSFGLRLGPSYLVTAQNETIGLSGYLVPPPSDPEDGAPVMQRIALRPAAGGEDHQSRQMLPDGWRAGLDLSAAALSAETAFRFWPQSVVPNTRSWVLRNVFSGQISDARLSLRLAQTGKPQVGLTFRFDEASLWAMPRLPAFEDGQGFFSLQERRLAVQIAGASLPLRGARGSG